MLQRRAFTAICNSDEKVLDALVAGVSDIEIGDTCFWGLQQKIDPWTSYFWPELGLLKRDTVLEWWEKRKGKKLLVLQTEALEHSIEEAKKKKWDNQKDQEYVLNHLKGGLETLRGESDSAHPDIFDVD